MSVVVREGIGFAVNTGAAFYTDADTAKKRFTAPADAQNVFTSSEWSPWGDNNDEPVKIKDDILNCGVLSAAVETEARLSMGRGVDAYLLWDKTPDGTEELTWVSDPEINDFLEANNSFQHGYGNIYNMVGYGWGSTQLLLNRKGDKINKIKNLDVFKSRLQKMDAKTGDINNIYLCSDWEFAPTTVDNDKVKSIPLLIEGYELQQLNSYKESNSGPKELAMLHRILKSGSNYYPIPLHRSAKAWVAITRSVPSIKNAINKNQMITKYLIIVSETYFKRIHKKWLSYTPEEKQKHINAKYDEVNNFLVGEEKAGKTIMAGKYYDPISEEMVDDITITVLDDKMKDGKMLPDSAAADKQILFSMFFNPAIWGGNLLGDGASGGAGSGSDIREATTVLLNLLHPERQNNLSVYNIIKKFNGWSERLEKPTTKISMTGGAQGITRTPRLVFRYGNAILTTLDAGKSTQNISL